jgi:hypothetical protein
MVVAADMPEHRLRRSGGQHGQRGIHEHHGFCHVVDGITAGIVRRVNTDRRQRGETVGDLGRDGHIDELGCVGLYPPPVSQSAWACPATEQAASVSGVCLGQAMRPAAHVQRVVFRRMGRTTPTQIEMQTAVCPISLKRMSGHPRGSSSESNGSGSHHGHGGGQPECSASLVRAHYSE